MGAVEVLSALSDPARLALLGRIAGAGSGGLRLDAVGATGASARTLRRNVARLSAAGLVEARGPVLVARVDAIRAALEEVAPEGDAFEDGGSGEAAPARVQALFSRGRLVEIPRSPEVRLALLRHVVERFEPGRTYNEPEVNALLREVHSDHAALRRHLVDAGLLVRDARGTTYRRGDAPYIVRP